MAVNHLINYPHYNCIFSFPNLFTYLMFRCALVCAHLWCEFCYLDALQVNKLSNFTTEHRNASYTRDVTKDATSNTTQKDQRVLTNKPADMWFSLSTRKLSSCSKIRRPQNNFFSLGSKVKAEVWSRCGLSSKQIFILKRKYLLFVMMIFMLFYNLWRVAVFLLDKHVVFPI